MGDRRTSAFHLAARLASALVLCAGLAACATPVGIRSIQPAEAERLLTANVLSNREPSSWSAQLLARLGWRQRFESDPVGVLTDLHRGLGGIDESQRLFTLAELSFAHADRTGNRGWFLASAAYAWAYLFPEDGALAPGRFDPRLRLTMALYDRAVARGLASGRHDELDVAARDVPVPFGTVTIEAPAEKPRFGNYRLESFVSIAAMDVRGLRNHYRTSGIGAPVIARCVPDGAPGLTLWSGADPKVPMTVLLRFRDIRASLRAGSVHAGIEVFDPETQADTGIGGLKVPVESDATAAIGYALEGSPIWDFEIAGFRRGDLTLRGESATGSQLTMMHPYIPGRIPVVFVHGTASSPARWAEMLNELEGDSALRGRYQYWLFRYNTGNPIAASAADLRENLARAVADVDPGGHDPALSRMVVVGHSQGGLLTKMTVVDSGDRFWRAISDVPFDRARLRPRTREYFARTSFVKPLPFVKRVVFLATPHGGTVLASNWVGRTVRRFIRLPGSLLSISLDILRLQLRGAFTTAMKQLPTSVDNMSPTDPFLQTLRSLPIADGVHAHSIIARRTEVPCDRASDGVVACTSAHLDGVESELLVKSGHSTQDEPATIEEVRRILYEHLAGDLGEQRALASLAASR